MPKEVKKCLDRWSFQTLYDFIRLFNNTYDFAYLVKDMEDIIASTATFNLDNQELTGVRDLANYIFDSDYEYKDIVSVELLAKHSSEDSYWQYEEYKVICEYHEGSETRQAPPLLITLRDGYVFEAVDTQTTVLVAKSLSHELREITAPVLIPELVDGHGDIYSHEVVRKACREYNEICNRPNIQHLVDVQKSIMQPVESWITKCDMSLDGQLIKEGSWMMTMKVHDDEVWEAVKKGEFTGFSVSAKAVVETLNA